MQRVVFNANYMAYVDDAVDSWMREALAPVLQESPDPSNLHSIGFDFMVKKVELTWMAAVRFAETLDLDCSVCRWGASSFDVEVLGSVSGEDRFSTVVTYVSVDPQSQRPVPVPARVRTALGFTVPN